MLVIIKVHYNILIIQLVFEEAFVIDNGNLGTTVYVQSSMGTISLNDILMD